MKMLIKLKTLLSFLPGLLATCLAVLITGISNYQYAIGDQIIHLPFVRYLMDPNLYPNDDLIKILSDKPTYFWYLFTEFFKLIGTERGFFTLQILSLSIFLFAVYSFCVQVTKSRMAAIIAMLMFIFPKYSFGYSAIFNYSHFIPRNLTVGFIIFAMVAYLQHKKPLSYFMLGIICNMHILSVVPVFLTFISYDLFKLISQTNEQRIEKLKRIAKYFASFLLGISPLLLKYSDAVASNNAVSSSVNFVDYYNSVLTPFYVMQNFGGYLQLYNAALIVIFSTLSLIIIKELDAKAQKFMALFLLVCTSLVAASIFFENLYQKPFLLQLQLGRSAEYTTLIFVALFSYVIAILYQKRVNMFLLVSAVYLAILSPAVSPLFLVAFATRLKNKHGLIIIAIVSTFLLNKTQLSYIKNLHFNINIWAQESDDVNAQNWIKNNTDKDSVILAPYYIGGFSEPDFRTISERTNVLTNADLVETILNADFLPTTQEKINDVTGGKYDYLMQNDNLFDYYLNRRLYHDNLMQNKEKLKQKYGIDYVVVESDYDLGDTPVYQNGRYKVYK